MASRGQGRFSVFQPRMDAHPGPWGQTVLCAGRSSGDTMLNFSELCMVFPELQEALRIRERNNDLRRGPNLRGSRAFGGRPVSSLIVAERQIRW